MNKTKKYLKIPIVVISILVVVYIAVRIIIPQTTAFKAAEDFLRNSAEVSEQCGDFVERTLILKAEIKYGENTTGRSIFRLNFITDTGEYRAELLLFKIDGVWTVTDYC